MREIGRGPNLGEMLILFTTWRVEGTNEFLRRDADGCDRDRRHNIPDARFAGCRAPKKCAEDWGGRATAQMKYLFSERVELFLAACNR
jgi:hypothetical protein